MILTEMAESSLFSMLTTPFPPQGLSDVFLTHPESTNNESNTRNEPATANFFMGKWIGTCKNTRFQAKTKYFHLFYILTKIFVLGLPGDVDIY